MAKINVKKIKIKGKEQDKSLCDIECIYTSEYIHENRRKPEYMYFSVMHDDDGTPCSICLKSWINNWGTVIVKRELLNVFEQATDILKKSFYELSKEEIDELYDNSNLFEMEESDIMLDEVVLQNFVVEKEWINGKFKCKVIMMPSGYRCAYMGVPKDNPFFKKKHFQLVNIEGVETYFNSEIKTTHSINYSDFTNDDEYWYFGFDCLSNGVYWNCNYNGSNNTYGEYNNTIMEKFNSLEFCILECNSMCAQLRELLLVLKLNGIKNS